MPMVMEARKLAPATDRFQHHHHLTTATTTAGANHLEKCAAKKKMTAYLPYSGPGPQPASVARRNARERNRVKQVNNGFATLRQHIPPSVAAALIGGSPSSNGNSNSSSSSSGGRGSAASKKLSKVDTLRLAVEYIRSLQQLLDDHDSEAGSTAAGDVSFDSRTYHTPPSSEASVSPTPSYASSSENSPMYTTYAPTKCDGYENYEPMSPEDEELLDAIFCWQQQ